MAVEKLYPNGDDSGWTTGSYADIDEGTDSPNDGDMISTAADGEGEVINLDLTDSALLDSHTITNVTVKVRSQVSLPIGHVAVDLLIGGVVQGSQQDCGVQAAFATDSLNDSGWNVDWTAAQLDGMQVRLTAQQGGMPTDEQFDVSALQVEITYSGAELRDIAGSLPSQGGVVTRKVTFPRAQIGGIDGAGAVARRTTQSRFQDGDFTGGPGLVARKGTLSRFQAGTHGFAGEVYRIFKAPRSVAGVLSFVGTAVDVVLGGLITEAIAGAFGATGVVTRVHKRLRKITGQL